MPRLVSEEEASAVTMQQTAGMLAEATLLSLPEGIKESIFERLDTRDRWATAS